MRPMVAKMRWWTWFTYIMQIWLKLCEYFGNFSLNYLQRNLSCGIIDCFRLLINILTNQSVFISEPCWITSWTKSNTKRCAAFLCVGELCNPLSVILWKSAALSHRKHWLPPLAHRAQSLLAKFMKIEFLFYSFLLNLDPSCSSLTVHLVILAGVQLHQKSWPRWATGKDKVSESLNKAWV